MRQFVAGLLVALVMGIPTVAAATPGDIDAPSISGVNDLVLGTDGFLYGAGTVPAAILQIDPDDGSITHTFPIAAGEPNQLVVTDDDTLWFSIRGDGVLRRLDLSDGSVTAGADLSPAKAHDLVEGSDGRLWFVATDDDDWSFGAVDGATVEHIATATEPDGHVVVGPDGDDLFVSSCSGDALYRVDPTTQVVTPIDLSADANCPGAMAVGPDDRLWITFFDGLARFDTATDEVETAHAHARTRDRYDAIAASADGQVWALNNVWIVRVDPESMDLDRYLLPQPIEAGDDVTRPSVLSADPNGGIWGVYDGQLLDVELGAPTETDTTDPTATITTPASGADYRDDVALFADFTCDDSGSSVVECAGGAEPPRFSTPPFGPVSPLLGDVEFTVYARDAAGNTAEPTVAFHRSRTCLGRRVSLFPPFGGHGTRGNDVIYGQGLGQNPLDARAGNDRVCGGRHLLGGAGNDQVEGSNGNDLLAGGTGPDLILGGRGNDILIGGPGVDVCVGGPGRNVFRGCEQTFRHRASHS
jgi:streptogramin lyase